MLRSEINARHYRDLYGHLEARADAGDKAAAEVKAVIDQAWKGVSEAFRAKDYVADNSDGAEAMIGLITCYFIESNPTFRPLFAPATVAA